MRLQMAPISPRRAPFTTSPKHQQPPRSLGKPPPAAGRSPRRRTWKPPEPDAASRKPPPSPPETPGETPDPDPRDEDEDAEAENGSDGFDDKEVDPAEDDNAVVDQIRAGGEPPEEESPSSAPPPEAGAVAVGEEEEEEHEEPPPQGSMQGEEGGMQRIVDLVMWRDVSRSALVFGIGSFFFLSSSYAGDLDLSVVSAVSYAGLFYLAGMFLFNSIFRRGEVDFEESKQKWLVGEDDALLVIRMFLPYLNEILTKLGALFSGDPSTTMKMAMLLFALARCGGSITIWTMGKLAFFGMFTIPRFAASYSSQISRYGTFWLERFRDAWESCTHKKAAAAAAFTVFWNLSSTSARVWSVFMLAIVVKYYHEYALQGWGYNPEYGKESESPHEQRAEAGGGESGSPLAGGVRPEKASPRGKVAVVQQLKGPNGPRQRLRSGPPARLEIGPKERKKE